MNQKLETVTEKPTIVLTPNPGTYIHTPTRENFRELMRVYEAGGWKWAPNIFYDRDIHEDRISLEEKSQHPTLSYDERHYRWNHKEMCVEAGTTDFMLVSEYLGFDYEEIKEKNKKEGRVEFHTSSRDWLLKEGYPLISLQNFYKTQNLTPAKIQEINRWFEQNQFRVPKSRIERYSERIADFFGSDYR